MNIFKPAGDGLAWRCLWLSLAALALGAIVTSLPLQRTPSGDGPLDFLTSILLTVSWSLALRFVLLATWWPWLVLVVMACALAATQIWDVGGVVLASFLTALVLMTRSLGAWRLITPRQRSLGFALGFLALIVLFVIAGGGNPDEGVEEVFSALDKLGIWSLLSLIIFWFLSLFHLSVRMRLHFLRLRPKLAISAFFIGFVPLMLVLVLGSCIFYFGLGGSRALRATSILESWREMAAAGNDMAGAPFDTTFCWPEACAQPAGPGVTIIEPGEDLATLAGFVPTDRDTSAWFLMAGDLWLMRWQGPPQQRRVQGWLLGDRPLEYLSRMLKAGVEVTRLGADSSDGGVQISSDSGPEFRRFDGRRACYREVDPESAFWQPWRIFGGGLLPVNHVRRGALDGSSIVVNLRVGWEDLRAEYIEGEDNLNKVALIALSVLAFLFLTIELFAFFFGIRITEGFVQAVHRLHRGTRALARGELETVIEVPNEDEFGDLADSFNEMTVAIRQGREDALAKERLTRELETAREIQERLLPAEEPQMAGFEITGASIPSREIGGDYFDFIIRDSDTIGVAIGDVSGKGMPAALLMSNLQASLHGQVIHPSSVAEVVGLVNNLIVASTDPHMFATFFYGLLDTAAGTFTCTNAGHNPPLVLRADGSLDTIQAGGLLLGMLADQPYKQETVTLEPGDVVVLYTDGITEAVGPRADEDDLEAMFGEEALEEVVRSHQHLPATGIKEAILGAVSRHTEGCEQSDDITLVVIRRQG